MPLAAATRSRTYRDAANTIIANSGLVPDTVVMGADALSAFLNNADVQEQLNKLHLVVGGIPPTAPQGIGTAQFIGRLFRPYVSHLRLRRDIRRRGDATRSSR